MQGGGGIDLSEIVDFKWEVALGEEKLTRRELETLARLKAPLVRLRGQWVEMTAKDIAMAIELWKQRTTGQATVRELLGMALGAGTVAGGLEIEGVHATGWTGLNLTRANHVFHFDRWWNPAVENQATDRAYRIDQKRNVQVHKFVCSGTVEEKIDAMIESKKEIAEKVVGTGEGWLTELSTAELREVFTLRKEAVKG